jgi:hypothetical protein
MPSVTLDTADAAELAEILAFISQWLARDPSLESSLAAFTGHPAYATRHLRDDLDRFTFLLGASDEEQFLPASDHPPDDQAPDSSTT